MKRFLMLFMAAGLLLSSCKSDNMSNPLLEKSTLRYGAPAFDEIRTEHYMPAFNAAIAKGKAEIDSIVNNPDDPTFENTILALEYAGSDLSRVSGIFFNVNEANTNEQMQAIAEEISPTKRCEYSCRQKRGVFQNPGRAEPVESQIRKKCIGCYECLYTAHYGFVPTCRASGICGCGGRCRGKEQKSGRMGLHSAISQHGAVHEIFRHQES